MSIGIIDYGAGNLMSVKNALDHLGFDSEIVTQPDQLDAIEKLILPGVGSFGAMMRTLKEMKILEPLKAYLSSKKPYFGICLGYQALYETSEEDPRIGGLGILKGTVVKFSQGKVPQIGWNTINVVNENEFFETGVVYFVHSYFPIPEDTDSIVVTAEYHQTFAAAVQVDNIVACQFHPEKSGQFGLQILKRWLEC